MKVKDKCMLNNIEILTIYLLKYSFERQQLQRELLLLKQSLFERDQKIGQLEADLSKSQKRSPRQSTSGDECQISPEKVHYILIYSIF